MPLEQLWTKAQSTGVVVYGMRRFWQANEDDVALMLEKGQQIPTAHKGIVMSSLTDYYIHTDKEFGREAFDRIERQRWPNLPEEERLMPTIEFSLDKAEKQGIKQGRTEGIEQGRTEGIEQGRTEGIEQGRTEGIEQNRRDIAKRMLTRGMATTQICDVLQISKQELADIKRDLKN